MKLNRSEFYKIIENISFRFIQPHDSYSKCEPEHVKVFGKNLTIDHLNTYFLNQDLEIRQNLSFLEKIPHKSTLATAYIINQITNFLEPDECYLNVGVGQGYFFFAGVLNSDCTSIGIDSFVNSNNLKQEFQNNFNKIKHPRSRFFDIKDIEFFKKKHTHKIGLYFYDRGVANKEKEQIKALELAQPYLAKNAIIIINNTNLNSVRQVALNFVKENSGQYEILDDRLTNNCSNSIHPTFGNGIMILRKTDLPLSQPKAQTLAEDNLSFQKGQVALQKGNYAQGINFYCQAIENQPKLLHLANQQIEKFLHKKIQLDSRVIIQNDNNYSVKINLLEQDKTFDNTACLVEFKPNNSINYFFKPQQIQITLTQNKATNSPILRNANSISNTNALFVNFIENYPEIKGKIVLCFDDRANRNLKAKTKFLGFSSLKKDPLALFVPDPEFLKYKAYSEFRQEVNREWINWQQRKPTVFWRGSTTGTRITESNWQEVPRIKLCRIAQDLNDESLIDCKISKIVQVDNDKVKEIIINSNLVGNYIENIEFIKYKYLIDIDGNSNAWSGLFRKLLTGSCVLKVESDWKQWYYPRLKPWVNYVPIKNDMSDLIEKITWCREHDREAQSIGEQGRELALAMTLDSELQKANETILKAIYN